MTDLLDFPPMPLEDIPPALHDSIRRHHQHLSTLAADLRRAGIDEAQVTASIDAMIASYRAELVAALRAMLRTDDNA